MRIREDDECFSEQNYFICVSIPHWIVLPLCKQNKNKHAYIMIISFGRSFFANPEIWDQRRECIMWCWLENSRHVTSLQKPTNERAHSCLARGRMDWPKLIICLFFADFEKFQREQDRSNGHPSLCAHYLCACRIDTPHAQYLNCRRSVSIVSSLLIGAVPWSN